MIITPTVSPRMIMPARIHLGLGVYLMPERMGKLIESLKAHPEWEDDPIWEGIDG